MRCVFSSEVFSQVRHQSQSTLKLLKISSRDFSVKLEASCSSAGRRLHLVTKNHRFYVSKSLTKALRSYQTPETYLETIQNTLKLFENIYYKGWRFSGTSCRFFSILPPCSQNNTLICKNRNINFIYPAILVTRKEILNHSFHENYHLRLYLFRRCILCLLRSHQCAGKTQ